MLKFMNSTFIQTDTQVIISQRDADKLKKHHRKLYFPVCFRAPRENWTLLCPSLQQIII